jgi:endonuclease YncB( thermonuclease family)
VALLATQRTEPPLLSVPPPAPPAVEAPLPSSPPAPPVVEAPTPEPEPPAPPQAAELPPSPPPALPPLPEQEVNSLPVHPVPDYRSAPIPHVTMEDRNGNPIGRPSAPRAAAAPQPQSSVEPPQHGQNGRAAPAQQAALPPVPASLSGPAQATGTLTLALQGHSVRLFGVSAPDSRDRCLLGKGDPRPCLEVTQQALAAHLARSASVTCALPPGAGAALPTRICLDDKGVDIAGYLVGEGLALDDPKQTSDYLGAEGVARSLKKGLWAYR